MNDLCVIINSLNKGGGAERVIASVLNFLLKKNKLKRVYVFTLDPTFENTHYLDDRCLVIPLITSYVKWRFLRLLCYPLALVEIRVRYHFCTSRPKKVLSFLTRSNLCNIMSLPRSCLKIISFRNPINQQYENWLIRKTIAWVCRFASKYICITQGIANSLARDHQYCRNNIATIFNPIMLPKSPIRNNAIVDSFNVRTIRILSVGRLVNQKDHITAIKAIDCLLVQQIKLSKD